MSSAPPSPRAIARACCSRPRPARENPPKFPACCVDAGISGTILVIEPRRMAARLLAGWVAKQRGATLGREVGYAVRFDSKYRDDTRILYLTDGVFQRWIQDDPELHGVGAVVFDEFHERRLAVDIALARCLDLQDGPRPDLRVVVMSATLETAGLADFLAPATSLEAGGRTYPVDMLYRPDRPPVNDRRGGPPREIPVWEKMVTVCREAMAMPDAGNILMFLPGTHEIRKTIELLEARLHHPRLGCVSALQLAAARRAGSGHLARPEAENHRRHQRRGNLAHHRGC